VFLRDRADILKMRLLAVKSKQCANKKNKYHCPEVFLDAVADKLTTTADLFLDAELLSKFYYQVCFSVLSLLLRDADKCSFPVSSTPA
jgi:replication fork clamp-binding protein CrfC